MKPNWKHHLEQGLSDDQYPWDWTSAGLTGHLQTYGVAKAEGVWVGEGCLEAAKEVLAPFGLSLQVQALIEDGSRVGPGDRLFEISGQASGVLGVERPLLNLMSFVSGIATQTHELVSRVRHPRITCTRKTLPGYRDLSIYGVIQGGGHPHRIGLGSGILIKENHIASGGLKSCIENVRSKAPHGLKVEVEVTNIKQAMEAVEYGAEGLLLDNFSPDQVKECLEKVQGVFIEVSGGIHGGNISDYDLEGVDIISSGSLTHSVKALDLSLLAHGQL